VAGSAAGGGLIVVSVGSSVAGCEAGGPIWRWIGCVGGGDWAPTGGVTSVPIFAGTVGVAGPVDRAMVWSTSGVGGELSGSTGVCSVAGAVSAVSIEAGAGLSSRCKSEGRGRRGGGASGRERGLLSSAWRWAGGVPGRGWGWLARCRISAQLKDWLSPSRSARLRRCMSLIARSTCSSRLKWAVGRGGCPLGVGAVAAAGVGGEAARCTGGVADGPGTAGVAAMGGVAVGITGWTVPGAVGGVTGRATARKTPWPDGAGGAEAEAEAEAGAGVDGVGTAVSVPVAAVISRCMGAAGVGDTAVFGAGSDTDGVSTWRCTAVVSGTAGVCSVTAAAGGVAAVSAWR
jgi:hypothetical protein